MALARTYYSVNGEIVGEHRQGEANSRDYIRDSLGNVTAVYQNDWEIAEAIYKPYGEMFGNWNFSDYRFGWNGSHGYRRTRMAWTTHYVRARHYSQIGANWTTRDPLWPREMPYGYVEGRVISASDPSGMLTSFLSVGCLDETRMLYGLTSNWYVEPCKSYSWCEEWEVKGLAGKPAVIMQCINKQTNLVACPDCKTPENCIQENVKFAEYWEIDETGVICHGDCETDDFKDNRNFLGLRRTDFFRWSQNCGGCKGSHSANGIAKLFLLEDLPSFWRSIFKRPRVQSLPESPFCPAFFFTTKSQGTVRKSASCSIECCKEESFSCHNSIGLGD